MGRELCPTALWYHHHINILENMFAYKRPTVERSLGFIIGVMLWRVSNVSQYIYSPLVSQTQQYQLVFEVMVRDLFFA